MRTVLVLALLLPLPVTVWPAQDTGEKHDPSKSRVEVTGCVRGATLTETARLLGGTEDAPARRWRIRGSKALMKQIKEHSDRVLELKGTTRNTDSMTTAGRRIGKTNIYIGGDPHRTARDRDPLPDLPTIDVESFEPTADICR
jgi:hypothetical protein